MGRGEPTGDCVIRIVTVCLPPAVFFRQPAPAAPSRQPVLQGPFHPVAAADVRGVFPGAFVCRSGSLRSDALLPVAAVCVWADRRRERQGRACRAGPFPKRHPHEKGAAGDRLPLVRQWWGVADYFVSSFSGRMTTFTSLPSSMPPSWPWPARRRWSASGASARSPSRSRDPSRTSHRCS